VIVVGAAAIYAGSVWWSRRTAAKKRVALDPVV
jgi:hypothetical protein